MCVGDILVTSGGLVGKVTKMEDDDQVEIEIADGVRVRQVRSMVADVRAKSEPEGQKGRLDRISIACPVLPSAACGVGRGTTNVKAQSINNRGGRDRPGHDPGALLVESKRAVVMRRREIFRVTTLI